MNENNITPEPALDSTTTSASEPVATTSDPIIGAKPDKKPKDKSNTIKAILLAVGSSAIVVTIVVLLVIQLINVIGPSGNKATLYEHQAYFVPESAKTNTKYALVDKDGEALTEFNIEKFDSFVDGYTIIKTTDGWGIINDNGKMTVKPDEYGGLSRVGGLYTALKPGSSERKLIRGSGHVVTTYSSSLNTNLSDSDYQVRNAAAVVIKREDNKYDIYNAHGKHLKSVESKEEPIVTAISATGNLKDYITSISYQGGIIVIANNDLKEILNIETSEKVYRLSSVSRDHSQMIFIENEEEEEDYFDVEGSSRLKRYNLGRSTRNYAIYTDEEFREIGSSCSYINIVDSEVVPMGYISCYSENGAVFFDDKGVLRRETDTDRYIRNIPLDSKHYASYKYMAKTATINGRNFNGVNNVITSGYGYLIQSNMQRTVVDPDGKTICVLPTGATTFSGFDKNGLGIVRAAQASSTGSSYYPGLYSYSYSSYLINKNCNAVSDKYNSISPIGNYYVVSKNEVSGTGSTYSGRSVALIDKTGKVAIKPGEYSSISSASYTGDAKGYIVARKSDGKSILFDTNLKQIAEFEGSVIYDNSQGYFRVTGEKFITFYTLEGTELQSVPIGDGARSHT